MSFKKKVKEIVEAESGTPRRPGRPGKVVRDIAKEKERIKAQDAMKSQRTANTPNTVRPVEVKKSQSVTDNTHPFYQKVKELSRGNKKNKSLLEKKSKPIKTFKILLGTVDKKSKMVEGKKKKYWEPSFGVDMTSQEDIADAIAKEKAEYLAHEAAKKKSKKKSKKAKPDDNDDISSRAKDLTDPGHASQHGQGVPKQKPPAKKKKKTRAKDIADRLGLGHLFP